MPSHYKKTWRDLDKAEKKAIRRLNEVPQTTKDICQIFREERDISNAKGSATYLLQGLDHNGWVDSWIDESQPYDPKVFELNEEGRERFRKDGILDQADVQVKESRELNDRDEHEGEIITTGNPMRSFKGRAVDGKLQLFEERPVKNPGKNGDAGPDPDIDQSDTIEVALPPEWWFWVIESDAPAVVRERIFREIAGADR